MTTMIGGFDTEINDSESDDPVLIIMFYHVKRWVFWFLDGPDNNCRGCEKKKKKKTAERLKTMITRLRRQDTIAAIQRMEMIIIYRIIY